MEKEQIVKFLKENLSIEFKKIDGSYGSRDIKLIELKLCDEVISETYIED